MNTTMETIILLVGQFCSSLFLWIGIALLAERATISAAWEQEKNKADVRKKEEDFS